jgi:hypothetical protein
MPVGSMTPITPSSPAVRTECTVKSGRLTKLIAYLSLCMLAAAFGAIIGPAWSQWWAIFGSFGLASAVGLDVAGRLRARLADDARDTQVAMKAAQRLDDILSARDAVDVLRSAFRQLQQGRRLASIQVPRATVQSVADRPSDEHHHGLLCGDSASSQPRGLDGRD